MTGITDINANRPNSPPCMECASKNVRVRPEVDRFQYLHGDETVELQANVDVYTCQECGFEFTDSAAEDARHNAVCEFLGVMNPSEVKAVRQQYGLSRSQMASASRIGEASIARWESGSLIQSGAYDSYLFLLRFAENMIRIQQRASGQSFESQVNAEKKWQSITVTETLRQEQAAFSLTPMAA